MSSSARHITVTLLNATAPALLETLLALPSPVPV